MPASMNISIPETMKAFVEERVEVGGYGSVSEYIRELVRRDRKEQAKDRLTTFLLEGVESGEPIPVTPKYWENLRHDLSGRRARSKKKQSR